MSVARGYTSLKRQRMFRLSFARPSGLCSVLTEAVLTSLAKSGPQKPTYW
jgi:hypothetical protein